jgi:hypothetical protein
MTTKPWSVIVAIQLPTKIIELEIKYETEEECLQFIEQAPEHPNLEYTWGANDD